MDLAMRFGLNSGPTTAGVLRGEKSRFQLFGDVRCVWLLRLFTFALKQYMQALTLMRSSNRRSIRQLAWKATASVTRFKSHKRPLS
jgi:hypothetical protein